MVAVDELIQRMQGYVFWAIRQDLVRDNTIGYVHRNGHGLDAIFRVEGE